MQAGCGASILVGLDRKLAHDYEYKAFFHRIEELHEWHTEKASKGLLPCSLFLIDSIERNGQDEVVRGVLRTFAWSPRHVLQEDICMPLHVQSEDYFDLVIDIKDLQTLQHGKQDLHR